MRCTSDGPQQGPGSRIPPKAKPYKLYEFFAEDLDGNFFRVLYDFGWEEKGDGAS